MRLHCSVEFEKKDTWGVDAKTGKDKRKASVTKNELFRKMLVEFNGKFHFDYVLARILWTTLLYFSYTYFLYLVN